MQGYKTPGPLVTNEKNHFNPDVGTLISWASCPFSLLGRKVPGKTEICCSFTFLSNQVLSFPRFSVASEDHAQHRICQILVHRTCQLLEDPFTLGLLSLSSIAMWDCLYAVGCLAPPTRLGTIQNISRSCHISSGSQNYPWVWNCILCYDLEIDLRHGCS